jgi:hypothetical protein
VALAADTREALRSINTALGEWPLPEGQYAEWRAEVQVGRAK